MDHSVEDRRLVEAQLGRPTRGRWRVARRCHLGLPMVIENYPRLEDGTPFPTLFWLTCPILVARASRLESAGYMAELGEVLAADDALKTRFEEAVDRYRDRRDALEVLPEPVAPPGGGPDRVKCLHAHVAHELGDSPNPIGALTMARAGWPDCVLPCVAGEDK